MFLHEIVIENFRGYKNRHRIPVNQLTAFIGKNDAGKSSILDALAVFFDHRLGKIDSSDFCVHVGGNGTIRIGCVFRDFPSEITIDATSVTNLFDEYLLNREGHLEIHKVFDCIDGVLKNAKIFAVADHPTIEHGDELLSKKITELRRIADQLGVDAEIDRRSSAALRKGIWSTFEDLQKNEIEIQLDKEDAKTIWEQLAKYLPEFALFRADRPSTDEDAEVQDPLKVAIKQAIAEVQNELDVVKEKVKSRAIDVARRTIEKLTDFDDRLASELNPNFKIDPKWDTLFKLCLTADDEIPINKRGSGVRRLVLFSFFRAEAERLREDRQKGNIIYAIEEPETAQHPENQRKVIEALQTISDTDGCQVLLTTHVPGLAGMLPIEAIRYISPNGENGRQVQVADETLLKTVAAELGVVPDNRAKVLLCVEGPHDFRFLKAINQILNQHDSSIPIIFNEPKVAFVALGGSTLQEWVNEHYLRNVGLPEVHIYDRDVLTNGTYKYQEAYDTVNNRGDGSIAFLTTKRELENYLHLDAISDAFQHASTVVFSFTLDDDCDVEAEVAIQLGQRKLNRRSMKHWLNDDAANCMTVARLQARNAYDEVLSWFTAVIERLK
jgi:putative ATP-dependent endonuclease of the OLD family